MASRRGILAPLPGTDHPFRQRESVTPFTPNPALINDWDAQGIAITADAIDIEPLTKALGFLCIVAVVGIAYVCAKDDAKDDDVNCRFIGKLENPALGEICRYECDDGTYGTITLGAGGQCPTEGVKKSDLTWTESDHF